MRDGQRRRKTALTALLPFAVAITGLVDILTTEIGLTPKEPYDPNQLELSLKRSE